MSPDVPPSPPPPAGLSTGGTTWLTALSLSLSTAPSLWHPWQPVLATSTRTLPFLARCLHWHPTAAEDDQMGFWENIQRLFLCGPLSREIKHWNRKIYYHILWVLLLTLNSQYVSFVLFSKETTSSHYFPSSPSQCVCMFTLNLSKKTQWIKHFSDIICPHPLFQRLALYKFNKCYQLFRTSLSKWQHVASIQLCRTTTFFCTAYKRCPLLDSCESHIHLQLNWPCSHILLEA